MKKPIIVLLTVCFIALYSGNATAAGHKELSVSNIFRQEADAIVLIGVSDGKGQRFGSGFFVTGDGIIATNFHLINNAKRIFVKGRSNNSYKNIRIVSLEAGRDIALIKVDGLHFKTARLGDSNVVQVGQRVVAIGNPFGLESTVSDGLISALRRANNGTNVLQTTVPVSAGSSGGPLFNLQGEVIGITTGSLTAGQNLNFAIPINYVKTLLAKLGYPQADSLVYVVKPGDTLYGLAKKFSTTVKRIVELNNLTSSNIHHGQKIKIPR